MERKIDRVRWLKVATLAGVCTIKGFNEKERRNKKYAGALDDDLRAKQGGLMIGLNAWVLEPCSCQ